MHRDAKRFYAILQLDPAATDEDVRVAFRRRAKELHPDSETGDAEAFIWLKRAYDTLSDPAQRARYDRANQPAPAMEPHRWATPSSPMPPRPDLLRPSRHRRGGMGFTRYAIAFVIMAAISIGAVQAMIAWTGSPPSIQTRAAPAELGPSTPTAPASPAPQLPGSSKSGFWDPTPASPAKP